LFLLLTFITFRHSKPLAGFYGLCPSRLLTIQEYIRCVGNLALLATVRRNDDVVPTRDEDSKSNDNQANVSKSKAQNMKRILANLMEAGISETIDDG
jgi:hypothetical protein